MLMDFITVVIITATAVTGMLALKCRVNRSESIRAMKHLSRIILQYRKEYGCVPAESYIDGIKETLQGRARFGNLHYRARWIGIDSPADEVLVYVEENFHSLFLEDGFIVLRLNGQVEWMDKQNFKTLMAARQSLLEIQTLQK